jgi:hypothetical protein
MEQGLIHRRINPVFFEDYYAIKKAAIFQKLFDKKWLIPHTEVSTTEVEIILRPQQINFISYPYEWSFTQYKHAAQLTLRLQLFLLEHGFSLKDASAFNVTFHEGKAIFIDTLSIEVYKENQPWRALKQFSEHFFAPLLMAHLYGSRHLETLKHSINGSKLDEVKKMLSWKDRLHPTVHSHITLLSKEETQTPSNTRSSQVIKLEKASQVKILKVLESYISGMHLKENTEWSQYYSQTNYDSNSFETKKSLIQQWITNLDIARVVDLGGNDGTFGKVLLNRIDQLIVCDIDQSAIDHCYLNSLTDKKVHALVADIMQPSPAIGFNNTERESFIDRLIHFNPDVSLALALIHHITLTGNVPFEMSAAFFAQISNRLIIEFPDREDSWVQFILDSKRDARHLFDHYHLEGFLDAYKKQYNIVKSEQIEGTQRTLFLMERK